MRFGDLRYHSTDLRTVEYLFSNCLDDVNVCDRTHGGSWCGDQLFIGHDTLNCFGKTRWTRAIRPDEHFVLGPRPQSSGADGDAVGE